MSKLKNSHSLVSAINFLRTFVLNSQNEISTTGVTGIDHFRLNQETENQPTHFEIAFIVDNLRYRYGFKATRQRVIAEWLFYVPRSREARLFERELDEVALGEHFKEGKDIIERTRPNALFLSVIAQFNGKIAQKLIKWFRELRIISGLQDIGTPSFTLQNYLDGEDYEAIVHLIKTLDLGIDNLVVEKLASEPLRDKQTETLANGQMVWREEEGQAKFGIRTTHSKYDATGHRVGHERFDLAEQESEGTKKLFALAGPLVAALRNGQVLIIDELDARLHPLMTSQMIRLFNDRTTNPCHAQLIFTTHDTNLLGNHLFRRDQIWFVEKDRQGASILYSLVEFTVRNDASYERDYIKGRYGAVPLLNNLRPMLERS